MNKYVVKSGDTLYGISKQLGISVYDLKKTNNLTSDNLTVGQVLYTNLENPYIYYTVVKGDSLYSIARDYNTTVDTIKQLNNLTTNNLSIGMQLKLPGDTDPLNTSVYILYSVKSGDSLYGIAKKFNTTVDTLTKINNLTTNKLSISQTLKIPDDTKDTDETMPTYITYTVKSKDSLYKIANDYNITVDQIIKDNNLSSNTLSIGQKLKIPYEEETVLECFGPSFVVPGEKPTTTYIVKKGESLYSIAKKLNTSVSAIKEKNNLTSNLLNIGQVLNI